MMVAAPATAEEGRLLIHVDKHRQFNILARVARRMGSEESRWANLPVRPAKEAEPAGTAVRISEGRSNQSICAAKTAARSWIFLGAV